MDGTGRHHTEKKSISAPSKCARRKTQAREANKRIGKRDREREELTLGRGGGRVLKPQFLRDKNCRHRGGRRNSEETLLRMRKEKREG